MSAGTFLGLCRRQHLCRFSHLADGVHSCQVPFKASTVDADAKLKYRLVWSCMMCITSLKHIHIMYNRIYIYQYIIHISHIIYVLYVCFKRIHLSYISYPPEKTVLRNRSEARHLMMSSTRMIISAACGARSRLDLRVHFFGAPPVGNWDLMGFWLP